MFIERPYQTQAEEVTLSEYDSGVRRMLHVMATGTGKTIVFSNLYKKLKSRLPGQMLVISHTDELVTQNRDKMLAVNPDIKVGKEMAGEYADPQNDDVISASVQTLGRKGTERVKRFNWENITKVVIDEAHHSTTESYRRILDLAGSLSPDTRKLLMGFTATPQRMDGITLSEIYEKVAFVYSIRQGIVDGWLSPIRGYRVSTEAALDNISRREGDFVKSELSAAINTPSRNQRVVESWNRLGQGRPTIAFCADIEHAITLAAEFKSRGISSEAVWGDDPEREDKLRKHRDGGITVLCNCAVLIEGYDDWRVSCIVLASPTMSAVKFAQMVGRGTRIAPVGESGPVVVALELKQDCIVIDIVDNYSKHSLLTLPTLMGLQPNLDLDGGLVLDAVEAIEKLAEENPGVDFTKLDSLDKAKMLIEQVDFMQVRFPAEVEANSTLVWYRAATGGFRMIVPKEGSERAGFLHIRENILGRWELQGEINGEPFHGIRLSMEEMFKVADEQVRKRINKVTLQKLLREATWHNKPVTKGQRTLIERLFPHRQFPWEQMTSGQASRLIGERFARRTK